MIRCLLCTFLRCDCFFSAARLYVFQEAKVHMLWWRDQGKKDSFFGGGGADVTFKSDPSVATVSQACHSTALALRVIYYLPLI